MARNYSSIATAKTLAADVTNLDVIITLNNLDYLPSVPYTLVINPDTTKEEIVTVVTDQSEVSAPSIRVARAQEGTTAQNHTNGNTVKHMITGRDLQETQDHLSATTSVHGIANTSLLVTTTGSQTLTNKTINGSNNTITGIAQSSVTNLVSDLALKAPLAGPTFTGTVTLPTGVTGATGAITNNMLAADAVTSAKIVDGTITNADINASAAIDWTKLAVSSTVSATEIGYVDGVTSAIQTQLNSKYNNTLSVVAAKTSDYTIASGDEGKMIELNGTFTVLIPTDATFNFAIGTEINLLNIGTGIITVAAVTPGTTIVNGTPGLNLRAQWSSVSLFKRAANNWVVIGDLVA